MHGEKVEAKGEKSRSIAIILWAETTQVILGEIENKSAVHDGKQIAYKARGLVVEFGSIPYPPS